MTTRRTVSRMYRHLDAVLKRTARLSFNVVKQAKLMPYDEMNVLGTTKTLFEQLEQINLSAFRDIARHYYYAALQESRPKRRQISSYLDTLRPVDAGASLRPLLHRSRVFDAEDELIETYLAEILRTPSPVMKYSYDSEVVRKRERLTEALIATKGNKSEYDTALNQWTQMTGWFSIEVADEATRRGREEAGVEKVRWVSEHDTRVCNKCITLDGRVFSLQSVPKKPHPRCRCYTVPV